MGDYTLNDRDIQLNIWISTGASAASFILCAAVLAAAAWVWSYPQFRMYLDRVSFRLLLWSMVFELAYDIAYIAVELYSIYGIQGGACGAGVYFMMAFMGVVNYLCTAIAVNLALTISFGMNPIKQRLERWYVGVSIALGMFVPVIPAGLGHFGYDPILHVCWITGETDMQRLRYFILDLYLWQILSCVVATTSVILVLITLIRQRRATSAALYAGNKLNRDLLSSDDEDTDEKGSKSARKRGRRSKYLWARLSSFSTSSTSTTSSGSAGQARPHRMSHTMSQLEDRFLRIALKISAYPVALIIVNVVITVGDLTISKDGGVYSRSAYALYCVYYFLYGGRGIVFGLLALFIDPCLRFGLRAVWRAHQDPSRTMPGIELESSRLDTMERSFQEMLAMPDPSTNPAAYDEFERSRRAKGMGQARRAKSRPAALRLGLGGGLEKGEIDLEMGDMNRCTQSLPDAALGWPVPALDFDAPGWAPGYESRIPGTTPPPQTAQVPTPLGMRRASSSSSIEALKEEAKARVRAHARDMADLEAQDQEGQAATRARDRRVSSTSIDMPSALTRLAFEAEQNRPPALAHTYMLGATEVSPRGTAPSTPQPEPSASTRRTSFSIPLKSPKPFSARIGRKSFTSPKGSPVLSHVGMSESPTKASVSHTVAQQGRRASQSDSASRLTSPIIGSHPSRSFVGVNIESLPAELTDTVDVQRPSSRSPPPGLGAGTGDRISPTRREFRFGSAVSNGEPKSGKGSSASSAHPSRTPTPPVAVAFDCGSGSCIDLPPRRPSLALEALDPDLPNATEEAIRRIRAAREQKRQEKEAAIMAFLQTKAML